jgi:cytochrome P450
MSSSAWPPGPPGHLIRGNLPEFRRDRLDFFVRCARDYGDVVALRFGPRRIFLVSHPDLIEQVVVNEARHVIKHFALRLNPLVLGQGLLTSSGDFWLRQRRLIQPAFSRERLYAYAADMTAAAERLSGEWRDGEERELLTEMMRLTLDIAARTLFGTNVRQDATQVAEALAVLQEIFLKRFNSLLPLPTWIPTPQNLRLRRAVRRLDAILYRFIAQRRAEGDQGRHDLLSLLLHAQDEDGSRMTDRQLRDEAMTLFLAGHETTALTLAWTWYLLGTHPDVEERLFEEARTLLGDRPATGDDVPQLKFAEAVTLEAMRLYPPAYVIGREAVQPFELGGYAVPPGLTILMSQWVVQRDPRFYDEPEKFRPERWLEGLAGRLPRYAYFPFGGGPRLCIGNSFAMMETALCLATLVRRWRCVLVPGRTVVPLPTFTLRPQPGIQAVLRQRGRS